MTATDRLDSFRERLGRGPADAALVLDPANMRYLTCFDGVFDEMISAVVVVTHTASRFYTDSRYIEAARTAAAGTPWDVRQQRESLLPEVCADLHADGTTTLAVESTVSHARFMAISDLFHGDVVASEQWVESLRAVKDAGEIEACAKAAALTDRAFDHVLGVIRPGMREIDVALELEMFMRRNGSEGLAFEPIVASGPNSSRPHAGITTRVIVEGDLLTMDFGARVDGYCADMTRTVVIGRADDEQRRIYAAVLAANMAGLEAVRAGTAASDVDAAARVELRAAGLEAYFGHGLGHGVGLRVHETPNLNPRSKDVLRAGEVVTIEPGVYLPGFGGVRIEDLVMVREGGHRLLSHSTKDLIEIP